MNSLPDRFGTSSSSPESSLATPQAEDNPATNGSPAPETGEYQPVQKLEPGTLLEHATGGRSVLHHRKADDSGWWNADRSGFSDEALKKGLKNGDWRIIDPPAQGEVPEIFYIDGFTVEDALRKLASRFEHDDDLVLIGLWNIEPPENEFPTAYLQVVVTHLTEAQSGRGPDV